MATCATPKVSTLALTPAQRALGRVVSLPVGDNENLTTPTALDLAGDIFWRLYQQNPQSLDPIPAGREINRRLIDWCAESPSFEPSRAQTVGTLLASAMSAAVLQSGLMTDANIAEAMKKQAEAEEQQQQANGAEAAADAAEASGQSEMASDLRQQAAKARGKAAAAIQQANDTLDKKLESPIAQAVRAAAIKESKDAAEDAQAICSGWGMDAGSPETIQHLPEIINTMKRMPRLGELVKRMAGAKNIFASHMTGKKHEDTHTLVQDGYTRHIAAAFPSEAALLRPDAPAIIRATKMGEFADRGLLGMVTGNEPRENGGLVVAVDESGSMGGNQYTLACALALGIAQAANENGQDFRVFRFSDVVSDDTILPDSKWQERINFVSNMNGGGTDFDRALGMAMQQIENLEQVERSSILMITDGQARIHRSTIEQFNALRETKHINLIYLDVSGNPDGDLKGLATTSIVATPDEFDKHFDNIVNKLGEVLAQ